MRLRGFRPDPLKVDWAVAAVLAVVGELEVWLGSGSVTHHHRVAIGAGMVVLAALVSVRRLYPGAVGIAAAVVGNAVAGIWAPPSSASYGIAWMCSMYALAAWARRPLFVAGCVVLAVPTYVSAAFGAGPKGELEFTTIALIVLLLVRRVLGDRERRAQMAERERDLVAREAVVEERARIARELHDVIAHNVSMMVVQAGAERRVLDASSGTHGVLATIEQIGRSALTETRRLVGMLREDAADPLAPQPGLGDLPRLVTQVREAGLPVELHVEGERRELPVGIDLSAYRIVQEALTNALKHAGDARADVRVRYGADSLELEIVDDGSGGAADGAGHGLVGMRERVALYGGRLDARRREGGGFAVRALLPIR